MNLWATFLDVLCRCLFALGTVTAVCLTLVAVFVIVYFAVVFCMGIVRAASKADKKEDDGNGLS